MNAHQLLLLVHVIQLPTLPPSAPCSPHPGCEEPSIRISTVSWYQVAILVFYAHISILYFGSGSRSKLFPSFHCGLVYARKNKSARGLLSHSLISARQLGLPLVRRHSCKANVHSSASLYLQGSMSTTKRNLSLDTRGYGCKVSGTACG
jgi:hypothetical protein